MSLGHIVDLLSVVVEMGLQSQSPTGCSVRSQAFLLSVHLEMKSFADRHIVHPVVIVLIVVVVTALQSQSPMSRSVRSQAFLLSVRLELKSFAVPLVIIVLDAIILVLVLQDATILVIALDTLTILGVDLQNVIGVAFELHGMIVAVGTLRNVDGLNTTILTHLADALCVFGTSIS